MRLGETDWTTIDFTAGRFVTENVRTTDDRFGGHTTKGILRSEFQSRQENIEVVAGHRNAEGEILGGGLTFVDFVDPGTEIAFEINTSEIMPGPHSTEVYWQL